MKSKILRVSIALILALSLSLVMATPAAAATLEVGTGKTYTTIQDAIDAASAGDIIVVYASGSPYTEDLDIPTGKDNLELKPATGESVTIKGVATEPDASFPLAVPNIDILSSGVKIHGFTIEGPDAVANEYASGMLIGASNVEIYDNDFKVTAGRATWTGIISTGIVTYHSVAVPTVDISGLNIHDNTFTNHGTGAAGFDAIFINLDTGTGTITIADNEFTGNVARAISVERSNAVISGNSIITDLAIYTASAGGYQGMFIGCFPVGSDPGPVQTDVSITGNTVKGATSSEGFAQGIRVGHTTQLGLEDFTVSRNTVQDCDEGITVRADASGVAVNYNSITGNTVGVQNDDTGVELDATNNWWGSAVGPTHSTNVVFNSSTGRGDDVSDDVDFVPWYDTDMTGSSFAPVTVGTGTTYHTSIQAGIDAASQGDTITAATGQFDEDLTVNTANLILKSAAGSTTVALQSGVGIDIQSGASGFTLGGASGEGFTIADGGTTTFDIQLSNAPSNVEISYNTIDTDGNASMGVSVGAAGASGLTVSNNTFNAGGGDGAIWGPNVADVTVSTNTISGGSYGVQFSGVTGTSSIDNNTISGCTGSGGVVISNGAGTSGLTITNNNIMGCGNGIYFVEYTAQGTPANMTTVTVTYNYISGSTNDAVKIGNGTYVLASNFTINYNAFINSTGYGLENQHTTEQVTAEWNWWDFVGGPDDAGNKNPYDTQANAAGAETCTLNVDFTPWMIHTSLASGWNIYSTPIASGNLTDTPMKALDFWGDDSSLVTAAYYFDSSSQLWATPSTLTPLQPVYLNLSGAVAIDVLISTGHTAPPARTMHQGWNLVGLAELYDVQVDTSLTSAYYGTGAANLVGYSQVLSPSINQSAAWVHVRDVTATGKDFVPTEGYWVYMVNQGTLGGFTYTPITPLP